MSSHPDSTHTTKPDASLLGSWIRSWVQPTGAIHGFHNHSVWGGNPYRFNDWTAGHSTWASPFLAGLASALRGRWNKSGQTVLEKLIGFQTASLQGNGHYQHIGFQCGERLGIGLIHNVMTDVALAECAIFGKEFLPSPVLTGIQSVILANLESCRRYGGGRPGSDGTCNQEYARIWAKILFENATGDGRFDREIPVDLDHMIKHYHVKGLPDVECEGTYRHAKETQAVEPAEYYGLMICPLLLAYERYGETRFLDHALALARHVVRSSWVDLGGNRRFHRIWYKVGEEWHRNKFPMLIAGMGYTLEGVRNVLKHRQDPELSQFLSDMDSTYGHYQHPHGFFLSATGWDSEVDIAPSTAWHAHDFRYLVERSPPADGFWDSFFADNPRTAVLLGKQCLWVERGANWMIEDYFWQDVFKLLGRKDRVRFGRDLGWVAGSDRLPPDFSFTDPPKFLKDGDHVRLFSGDPQGLDIMVAPGLRFTH